MYHYVKMRLCHIALPNMLHCSARHAKYSAWQAQHVHMLCLPLPGMVLWSYNVIPEMSHCCTQHLFSTLLLWLPLIHSITIKLSQLSQSVLNSVKVGSQVMVEGKVVASLDRNKQAKVSLPAVASTNKEFLTLEILVEGIGRDNSGSKFDLKGLMSQDIYLEGTACISSNASCCTDVCVFSQCQAASGYRGSCHGIKFSFLCFLYMVFEGLYNPKGLFTRMMRPGGQVLSSALRSNSKLLPQ